MSYFLTIPAVVYTILQSSFENNCSLQLELIFSADEKET